MNFLSLFDDYLLWMRTKMGVEAPIQLMVHESACLVREQSLMREMAYDQYHISDIKRIPMLWGERELTFGGCPVSMYIEKESDTALHIKFVGDMRAFTGSVV